jgi:type II secretory pathway component GspD/PulD (secretin)
MTLAAVPSIDAVTARHTSSGVEVVFEGKDLPKPSVVRTPGGADFSLVFNAKLPAPVDIPINKQGIEDIKSTRRSKWSSVVAMRIEPSANPVLEQTDLGWVLKIPAVTKASIVSKTPAIGGAKTQKPVAQPALKPTVSAAVVKPHVLSTFEAVATAKAPAPKAVRVTLEFVNTEVVQILRALALQTGVNIVASPEVKGSLTVSLTDVDVEDALKMVTSMTSLAYTRVGSTVMVAPENRIDAIRRSVTGEAPPAPEPNIDDAYLVRGGSASDLVAAVAGKGNNSIGRVALLATPAGSASRQTIVLRGPAADVKVVRHTIEQLDDAEDVVGSYEIYEVKHLDPRPLREELINAIPGLRASILPSPVGNPGVYKPSQISKDAQTQISAGGGAPQTGSGGDQGAGGAAAPAAAGGSGAGTTSDVKSSTDNRADRDTMGLTQPFQEFEKIAVPMKIVLRGSAEQIQSALKYLKKIDVAPKQVALELRVMELTKDQALRVGLDWSVLSGKGTVQSVRINQGLGDTSNTAGTITGVASGGVNVLATLDSIADANNLIARPNLLAVDGRSAELFVGDVIRYIQTIQTSQNGTTVQTGEEHVGVRLAVMPRISAGGNVTMELRPIVSYLTGYTPVPGGGQLPQTSERIEQTTAVVHDGDTIALGGLIQTQDRNTVSGIPFLKDLPIIGHLFKRTDKDKQRKEVVFFLTTKIVSEDDKDRPTAADPRIEKKIPEIKG